MIDCCQHCRREGIKVVGLRMKLSFKEVKRNCSFSSKLFLSLKETFEQFIEPIYGKQEKFLEKIRVGLDRKCVLLTNGDVIEGVLVYKTNNSSEFERFDIENALEIKTLMLIHKNKKFAGLMVVLLYKYAAEAAIKNNASCISATVSSNLKDAFGIAKRLGFVQMGTVENKNINGAEELLLCHPSPFQLFKITEEFGKKYDKKIEKH